MNATNVQQNGQSDKLDARGAAIVAAGLVIRLDELGGSVANGHGIIYRVDLDLGGRANCQCWAFRYNGDCKHLRAIRQAQAAHAVEVNAAEWANMLRTLDRALGVTQ